jgi:hypothetical protein
LIWSLWVVTPKILMGKPHNTVVTSKAVVWLKNMHSSFVFGAD